MSLILDAINRSQRERANPGEVPGVATQHYSEATIAPGAWRQGLLGLALVVALGVIAWLLLSPQIPGPAERPPIELSLVEQPSGASEAATQPGGDRAPEPARSEKPAEVPAGDAGNTQPSASAPTENPSGSNTLTPTRNRASARPETNTGVSRREAPAAVAALYANSPERAADSGGVAKQAKPGRPEEAAQDVSPIQKQDRQEEPVDVEALLREARAGMANAPLVDHPAPFLVDLSQQRKDAIPTLLYSAHDYRSDGGQSTVLINGNTVSEGGSPGKDVTVDEILPDSVILSFAGQQFRLRALNSWVNL